MPPSTSAARRERFLTARWNNAVAIGLGIPAAAFAGVSLATSALSDRSAFIGMVVFGAVY